PGNRQLAEDGVHERDQHGRRVARMDPGGAAGGAQLTGDAVRIRIRTLWSCEPELDRWVESLPGTDPERRELARTHLELVYRWMEDNGGVPPGAIRIPRLSPPAYWWNFIPGWWMRFAVRDRRRWLRTTVREVLILGVQDEPPGGLSFAM